MVEQYKGEEIAWLDLGVGTGTLEQLALERFPKAKFVLLDPSDKMLEQAQLKLGDYEVEYLHASSTEIKFQEKFDVITVIQSHHYLKEDERKVATKKVYEALKEDGIYISFENVIPEDEEIKREELLRWGRYQQRHGKTKEQADEHNARCGINYFPLTVAQHIDLLKETGFRKRYVFWKSYMQMGIYAIK